MSSESTDTYQTLRRIVKSTGLYPEAAYHFVREGLEYAARAVHGPMTPAQSVLAQYMAAEKIDLAEVFERHTHGALDSVVAAAIERSDGPEELNRNVSGADLCWALRDFALRQWGMLASLVLGGWNITKTEDFGRIVFTLVEHDVMQKEPQDSIDHFKSVYEFDEALEKSFQIDVQPGKQKS